MSELTGLDLLMSRFGKDAYRDTHIGRRTGRTYYLFITSDNEIGFDIKACYLQDDTIIDAGFYSATTRNIMGVDPRWIFVKPKIPPGKTLYYSNVGTDVRGDGIASALFDRLIPELRKRKALHIESFTEEGLRKMKRKYTALGYQDCELTIIGRIVTWLSELKNWMYYDYK